MLTPGFCLITHHPYTIDLHTIQKMCSHNTVCETRKLEKLMLKYHDQYNAALLWSQKVTWIFRKFFDKFWTIFPLSFGKLLYPAKYLHTKNIICERENEILVKKLKNWCDDELWAFQSKLEEIEKTTITIGWGKRRRFARFITHTRVERKASKQASSEMSDLRCKYSPPLKMCWKMIWS